MKLNQSLLQRFTAKFLAFFVGCFATAMLTELWQISSVISSAGVGLLASFIPKSRFYDAKKLSLVAYCGSFAGMAAPEILGTPFEFFLVSFAGAGIFIGAQEHFKGVGGKLGAMAFLSVFVTVLVTRGW